MESEYTFNKSPQNLGTQKWRSLEEFQGSGSLILSRIHRQQERALARTSKNAVPFRACFLFDNSPNLYNWNVKRGFSQGTGWELMDQSALPHQCFTADFWNVFDEKRATSSDRRYWCSLLRLGPTGTIHQCYQDFTCFQLHSKTDNRRESIFLKPLLSVVLIINSHMLCLSLEWGLGEWCRHHCLVLICIKSFFSVAF